MYFYGHAALGEKKKVSVIVISSDQYYFYKRKKKKKKIGSSTEMLAFVGEVTPEYAGLKKKKRKSCNKRIFMAKNKLMLPL